MNSDLNKIVFVSMVIVLSYFMFVVDCRYDPYIVCLAIGMLSTAVLTVRSIWLIVTWALLEFAMFAGLRFVTGADYPIILRRMIFYMMSVMLTHLYVKLLYKKFLGTGINSYKDDDKELPSLSYAWTCAWLACCLQAAVIEITGYITIIALNNEGVTIALGCVAVIWVSIVHVLICIDINRFTKNLYRCYKGETQSNEIFKETTDDKSIGQGCKRGANN